MTEEEKPVISRQKWKSCCGSMAFVLQLLKPIKKNQLHYFTESGYLAPANFLNAGIFYVQKDGLIANASYGSTRINVRCNGPKCAEHLEFFEAVLKTAILS